MKILPKHKDITRLGQELKCSHGWFVRLRFNGKTHSKFFSDLKCGGIHSALLAAITWRDEFEKILGKPRTDKHLVTVSNTSTGVVGVRLNDNLHRYEVTWVQPNGKQGRTTVSILKHGKKKAFVLACKIRTEKERQRLGSQ